MKQYYIRLPDDKVKQLELYKDALEKELFINISSAKVIEWIVSKALEDEAKNAK